MNSFQEMGLHPIISQSLASLNFTTPTPIQAQTIPLALTGRDILGSAQTGTGKTLAFTIPLVHRLLQAPSEMALVLVPTRELAQQVATAIRQVTNKQKTLRTALLIGGDSFFKQLQQLRADARIIVGTPGRVIDHLSRNTLKADKFSVLVLDEMDRMFDMGFEKQIERIVEQIPQQRQTLMFSATLPSSIIKTASRYLDKPERIAIGDASTPVAKIKQDVVFVAEAEKEAKLLEELTQRHAADEAIVIFVKTKWNAEKLAEKLSTFGHKAIALHGDLRQNKRERVVASFRKGTYSILVATDIAARGLDIPQIRHIINYDLPQCPEDYIHRIGRTGRAGAEGFSLCLVTPKETKNWKIINKFANTSEGISDQDRAALSHKGPRRGDRQGSRGGRSFGERSDRGERPRFGGNRERRSDDRPFRERRSFKKDHAFDSEGAQEGGFERKRSFKKDRPFGKKPFFNERPSFFEGQEEEHSFARKPRFNRFEGDSAPRFERSNNRSNDFSRPFRKNRDGEGFEKPFGRNRSFSQDQDKPFFKRRRDDNQQGGGFFKKRPFFEEGSSSEGGFAPKKRSAFKPRFDRAQDQGPRTFKRKKRD